MINKDELEKIIDKVIDNQEEEYEVQTTTENVDLKDLVEDGEVENVYNENK